MSFTIKLQKNSSDKRVLDKEITDIVSISGNTREETSLMNPVFTIDITNLTQTQKENIFLNCNFLSVAEFGRSYFVSDITIVRKNLLRLTCHIDVLYTYKEELKKKTVEADRQEIACDMYRSDSMIPTEIDHKRFIRRFSGSFGQTREYVLTVAGH